jgi:pyrroline-5-carboxylate reductase
MDLTLAIIGAGNMGEALLRGLLRSGWITADRIVCADTPERCEVITQRHGVRATPDNAEAVTGADIVVLAVKPQIIRAVLSGLADALTSEQTVISIAAGTTTAVIEGLLAQDVPVVRVMPNTPALVDEGMAVVAPGAHATAHSVALAREILGTVGAVLELPESLMDAVTAVSGTGPAYVFYLAEALVDAGVDLGLGHEVATELVVQTMIGSAALLRQADMEPAELRAQVTSPGGTTAAAVTVLDGAGVQDLFRQAVAAAARRSSELAEGG